MGDAMGDYARFPAACPGQQQEGAFDVGNCLFLLRIQALEEIHGEGRKSKSNKNLLYDKRQKRPSSGCGPEGGSQPLLSGESPCNLTICWCALQMTVYAAGSRGRMLVDFEQIQKAQAGDDAAFNRVVVAYRKRILGTIARLIGRPEDVEDVAQEVFLRLYFSLDQLRTAEVFEPWLYRLTVNASYDYLRRRRGESRMADLSEQQVLRADATAGGKQSGEEQRRNQAKELVDELLESVSEEDRILLKLKEVEGLSLKELEKIYSVNENALKVRLFRARQRVLKAYEVSQGKPAKADIKS